jgi:hypothetical protein
MPYVPELAFLWSFTQLYSMITGFTSQVSPAATCRCRRRWRTLSSYLHRAQNCIYWTRTHQFGVLGDCFGAPPELRGTMHYINGGSRASSTSCGKSCFCWAHHVVITVSLIHLRHLSPYVPSRAYRHSSMFFIIYLERFVRFPNSQLSVEYHFHWIPEWEVDRSFVIWRWIRGRCSTLPHKASRTTKVSALDFWPLLNWSSPRKWRWQGSGFLDYGLMLPSAVCPIA